jgi:hypothetical protein
MQVSASQAPNEEAPQLWSDFEEQEGVPLQLVTTRASEGNIPLLVDDNDDDMEMLEPPSPTCTSPRTVLVGFQEPCHDSWVSLQMQGQGWWRRRHETQSRGTLHHHGAQWLAGVTESSAELTRMLHRAFVEGAPVILSENHMATRAGVINGQVWYAV